MRPLPSVTAVRLAALPVPLTVAAPVPAATSLAAGGPADGAVLAGAPALVRLVPAAVLLLLVGTVLLVVRRPRARR